MDCSTTASPSFTVSLGFAQIHVRWSWWCYLTVSSAAPSPFAFTLSQHQGLFQWLCSLRQVAKYWHFSFSISPSIEYSGLISFTVDWFDLLIAQGILKSLLQYHSSKVSILWHSAFFMVQFSHLYMMTRKSVALYGPLSAKWYLCFWLCCLGWS